MSAPSFPLTGLSNPPTSSTQKRGQKRAAFDDDDNSLVQTLIDLQSRRDRLTANELFGIFCTEIGEMVAQASALASGDQPKRVTNEHNDNLLVQTLVSIKSRMGNLTPNELFVRFFNEIDDWVAQAEALAASVKPKRSAKMAPTNTHVIVAKDFLVDQFSRTIKATKEEVNRR